MFRYYYFFFRFKKWFQNEKNGIQKFSEQSLGWFIRSAVKKSQKIRRELEIFKNKKSKLAIRLDELEKLPLLDNDEYFSIRKKIRFQQTMIPIIILIEVFLNYVSTLVFINGEGVIFSLIRWGIALVLTLTCTIVADKLLEVFSPNKLINRIKIRDASLKEQPILVENGKNKAIIKVVLLSVLLIMTEIAIIGVSETRARDIEGGKTGGILYYGFILLSMALPLVAGYLRWDMLHDYDAYKNTQNYRWTKSQLQNTEQYIIKLNEIEKYYFKNKVNHEWQILSEFKNYKEVYNQKKNISQENLSNHFSRDRDSFIEEAVKEYNKEFKTIDSSTKLEIAEKKAGEKIGQISIDSNDNK